MPEVNNHGRNKKRLKKCALCDKVLPIESFYVYAYTTNQGNRSTRYESRCRPCARARRRQQTLDNPGKAASDSRAWRGENPTEALNYARQYRGSDHGKRIRAKCQRVRKARIRNGMSGPETNQEIQKIYADAMQLELDTGIKYHVDHIVPISKGGKHIPENLQILTATENLRKGVRLSQPRLDGGM